MYSIRANNYIQRFITKTDVFNGRKMIFTEILLFNFLNI